jgi:hypothetical protein
VDGLLGEESVVMSVEAIGIEADNADDSEEPGATIEEKTSGGPRILAQGMPYKKFIYDSVKIIY